jgi:hypothetical protein
VNARGLTLTESVLVSLVTETCYACGTLFGLTVEFQRHRIGDKATWYCPNGHAQSYTGTSLRDQVAAANRDVESARRETACALEEARIQAARASKAETESKRLRTRAAAGVCPCCKRSFVQLARHVKAQHPGVES